MDDRQQQGAIVQGDRCRIDLDGAHAAIGQAVREDEVIALLTLGQLALGKNLGGIERVDVLDRQLLQGRERMAVEAAGGFVGIDDAATVRFDQQHDRVVLAEQAGQQLIRRHGSGGGLG